MPLELLVSLVMLTEPTVTHWEASAPVRIQGTTIRPAAQGSTIRAKVCCGPALRLSFIGQSGAEYSVQWSADLKTWSHSNVIIVGDGSPIVFHDCLPDARRFYRVVQMPTVK
jgi:hypothetical protein